jgi:hypothetical protein
VQGDRAAVGRPAGRSVGKHMRGKPAQLAGALRAEWAYVTGYVVQVAAIALGFVVPVMTCIFAG